MSSTSAVRVYGDPVLRRPANEVTVIDGDLVLLAREMLSVMYAEPGIGLAATQVGEEKRLFVYDVGDGPNAVVNPVITESDGLWRYSEGCLSLPGLFCDVVRPKEVLLTGWDLNEQPVEVEADELLARLFQHELDHLDGVLLIDHLEADERTQALELYAAISAAEQHGVDGGDDEKSVSADGSGASLVASSFGHRPKRRVGARWTNETMVDDAGVLAVPPSRVKRIAFLGTPLAAVPSLEALVAAGYDVALVVSQPDRRRGRGGRTIPSPVKKAAVRLGLTVTDQLDDLYSLEDLDLAVVVAFGRIIPSAMLQQIAMVNVHFSLLPRWRGAAPVERAILAGDPETGVSIMALAEGLDTGDVYASETVAIGNEISADELTSELANRGGRLLVETLQRGLVTEDGECRAVPQRGNVTYAAKLERGENKLSFNDAAVDIHRRVRIGRAWTWFRQARLGVERVRPGAGVVAGQPPGSVINVSADSVAVASGDGVIELLDVKPEGRRSQPVGDWVNGARLEIGERLGVEPDSP